MDKAILVIDMPDCCNECTLMFKDEYSYWCPVKCNENKTDLYDNYIKPHKKPDWCPLKLLPDKIEGNESVYYQWGDYEDGWNNCIDSLVDKIEI